VNDVKFDVSGDFDHLGTLELNISADGSQTISVGGSASLEGAVVPNFAGGVDISFGKSWEFLKAKDISNLNVQVNGGPALAPGLGFQVIASGGSASLTVGNLPVLSLDRGSGKTQIKNIVGGDLSLTGYTIGSAAGLLDSQGWTSLNLQQLEGWSAAPSSNTAISELNLLGDVTLAVNDAVDLGNVFNVGSVSPREEDVTFLYSTPDGRVLRGSVEYIGPANDLVVRVNPETGEAAIRNLSTKIDPFDVSGYSILSESGALSVEGWTSFAESGEAGEG